MKNNHSSSYSVSELAQEKSLQPFHEVDLATPRQWILAPSAHWLGQLWTLITSAQRFEKRKGNLYKVEFSKLTRTKTLKPVFEYQFLVRELYWDGLILQYYREVPGCEFSPYIEALLECAKIVRCQTPAMHCPSLKDPFEYELVNANTISNLLREKLHTKEFKRHNKALTESVRKNKLELKSYLTEVLHPESSHRVFRFNLSYWSAYNQALRQGVQPESAQLPSVRIPISELKKHWQNFRKFCSKAFGDSVEGFVWKLEINPDFGPRYHVLLILKSSIVPASARKTITEAWANATGDGFAGMALMYEEQHHSGLLQTALLPDHYFRIGELIEYYCSYWFACDLVYRPNPKIYGRAFGKGSLIS